MARASLDPNFREFLKLLNSAGVRYLLLGGYAVNYYGYHRATEDIDVWIQVAPENAKRVSRALQQFGFAPQSVPPELFEQRGKIFMFGRKPWRVDLLTNASGVDFEDCWERRVVTELGGVQVSLIGLEDLKANKRASGRDKDIGDLANLPAAPPIPPTGRRRTAE
jgi:predicted nucleotidyltransferase